MDHRHSQFNRPCAILHALKDWRDKNDVTWFLRGQVSGNVCRYKKLRSSLFNLDKRKWIDASRKLWVKVIMANTFLDAVTNADVLTASNNDVKLVDDSSCKFAWLKSSSHWESKETRPRLTLLANFTTYFPPEIPGDITFISSILKLVLRWRVYIMNKVYSELPLQKGNTNLFQHSNNTAFNEIFIKHRTPTSYFPQKGLQFSNEQSKWFYTFKVQSLYMEGMRCKWHYARYMQGIRRKRHYADVMRCWSLAPFVCKDILS